MMRAEWSADQRVGGEHRPVKARRGGLHGPGEQTSNIIPPLVPQPPRGEAGDEPEAEGNG
jgi:hypothetical protein